MQHTVYSKSQYYLIGKATPILLLKIKMSKSREYTNEDNVMRLHYAACYPHICSCRWVSYRCNSLHVSFQSSLFVSGNSILCISVHSSLGGCNQKADLSENHRSHSEVLANGCFEEKAWGVFNSSKGDLSKCPWGSA